MEYRNPLKMNTVLPLGGICCHVENVVGMGSNAIVYRGWYEDSLNPELRHHVLLKELFPLHPQGKIHRGAEEELVVEPGAEDFWEMHRESFEAGNAVHLDLLAEDPETVGANLNSCRYNGTLYTLLGYSGGRSLQEELEAQPQNLRQLTLRMLYVLDALEVFHKNGWLHLDISPDNIMLVGQGDRERIFLIDYNSARRIGAPQAGYLSCKDGYSAPEVAMGETENVGIPSDLYTVAAVFFRGLMGRKLSVSEVLRPKAPDGRESPMVADAAQTVRSLIAQILRKGLHTLPSKRYGTIGQMRRAFRELLERIDCVGVTHWALWENGRRTVQELIRSNPALDYLKDGLYPIRLGMDGGMNLQQYLDRVLSPEGRSGLILAGGGMGKTTFLLHTAMTRGDIYTSGTPAVFYLPVNDWDGTENYIRRRILMRLRFKPEENTFESAMLALHRLLERKLRSGTGEMPVVLLLLDGLNEVPGDPAALFREIRELQAMAGVRILAASRSEVPGLDFETVKLLPLRGEDVVQALGEKGLLVPENSGMRKVLQTPLLLALYIRAGSAGTQPDIDSEAGLMAAFLDAMLDKERKELPEDSPLHWQLEAALKYLLPVLASRAQKTGAGLTEHQLLALSTECWKHLRGKRLHRLFPQWIGHSRDIFERCQNPEEWMGRMVYALLWKKLGMLVRDSEGKFRVYHQQLQIYLADQEKEIAGAIFKARIKVVCTAAAAVLTLLLALGTLFGPKIQMLIEDARVQHYDEQKTETVIDQISVCYSIYGSGLKELQQLLNRLPTDSQEVFLAHCDRCEDQLSQPTLLTQQGQVYLDNLVAFLESGEQVAWSGLAFAGEPAERLITEAGERLELYREALPMLKFWASSERARAFCPDFPTAFGAVLDADQQVMSKLYYLSCYPHLEGAEEAWQEAVRELLAPVPGYETEPEENLESLRNRQQAAQDTFTGTFTTLRTLYLSENP